MNSKTPISFAAKVIASVVCILSFCHPAQAVMLNFDDLNPESLQHSEGILTNEYEAQGVVFHYSAYLHDGSPKSSPNYVVGPGFGFSFVNTLPVYVSFFTGSSTQSKVFIDARGPGGYFVNIRTEGEIHGMTDEESTPYIPNQFVEFRSDTGISSIELSGQSDGYIDDLTFYYPDETVPEPSTIMLFALGLGGLYFRQRKAI